MKKLVSLFLIVIMIFLVGCGSSSNVINNNDNTTNEENVIENSIVIYEEDGIVLTYEGIIDYDLGKEAVINLHNNSDKIIDFKLSKHKFSGSELFSEDYTGIVHLADGIESFSKPDETFMMDLILGLNDSEKATGQLDFEFEWNFQNEPDKTHHKKITINLIDGKIVEK